ncbi:hypothetical protein N9378_02350 [Flavobacteriaceae bacterium]|nr:hypothetical protein [Flavobacteriaceae bacterium]
MKKIILLILFVVTFSLESCVVRQVASKPNLVVVKKAPRNHQVVVIKKKKYYRWGVNTIEKQEEAMLLCVYKKNVQL